MLSYPSLSNAWVGGLQVCAIFQAIVSRQRYNNTKITKDTMLVLSQNPVGVGVGVVNVVSWGGYYLVAFTENKILTWGMKKN